MPDTFRGRAPVARGVETGAGFVDRANGVIYGFSVIEKCVLSDRPGEIDETSLRQIVQLGNEQTAGVRSRFGHPNMSSDAIGKYLGRSRNFRLDGNRVRADLYLNPAAARSPNGDLLSYVLDLAETDPGAFGASIHFKAEKEWRLGEDGEPATDESGKRLPPLLRFTRLYAADVVDTPAATSGFFSGTNVVLSAEATEVLSNVLSAPGAAVRLRSFLDRYIANQEGGQFMPTQVEAGELVVGEVEETPVVLGRGFARTLGDVIAGAFRSIGLGGREAEIPTEVHAGERRAQLRAARLEAGGLVRSALSALSLTPSILKTPGLEDALAFLLVRDAFAGAAPAGAPTLAELAEARSVAPEDVFAGAGVYAVVLAALANVPRFLAEHEPNLGAGDDDEGVPRGGGVADPDSAFGNLPAAARAVLEKQGWDAEKYNQFVAERAAL